MPPDQADQSTGYPPVKPAEQAQSTGRSDQDSSGARARSISLAADQKLITDAMAAVIEKLTEIGLHIRRIELDQHGSGFDGLIVFDSRIDVADGSADARADQIQVALDLSVIGRFVVLRVQPPQ